MSWHEEALAQASAATHAGDATWARAACALIVAMGEQEHITLQRALPGGSQALVVQGAHPRWGSVVVKCHLTARDARAEARALTAWRHEALPRLRRHRGALLVSDFVPGAPYQHQADDALHVARLLDALHHPAPAWAPPLRVRMERSLIWATPLMPEDDACAPLLRQAYAAAARAPGTYLLHGDCAPKNLLRCATPPLVALDPLPCAGPRAYDIATWALTAPDPDAAATELARAMNEDVEHALMWVRTLAVFSWLRARGPRRAQLAALMDE